MTGRACHECGSHVIYVVHSHDDEEARPWYRATCVTCFTEAEPGRNDVETLALFDACTPSAAARFMAAGAPLSVPYIGDGEQAFPINPVPPSLLSQDDRPDCDFAVGSPVGEELVA